VPEIACKRRSRCRSRVSRPPLPAFTPGMYLVGFYRFFGVLR
jgi:hypothetical protein